MNVDEPLAGVGSIKTKLAILVGASILGAILVYESGSRAGVTGWVTLPVALAAALGLTWWLARGLTAPLREMTAAASAMARGDYSTPVVPRSSDEVGQLARAFATMAADLGTTDQQRRDLIAMVSHELRTPLAAQRAVLENIVDGVAPATTESLASVLSQSDRLSELVTDLLDLSRIDAGASALRLTDIRVRDLLSEAVSDLRLQDRDNDVSIVVSPADLTVTGDHGRLLQVVVNLLDNAARHGTAGGDIELRATATPGEQWTLTVTDDGPGIAAADAIRVFDRYGTASATAASTGSTGLGLAIARWVCELHGGTIRVQPTPVGERGARLAVTLPTRPSHPTPPAQPREVRSVPTPPVAAPTSTPAATPSAYTPQPGREWWPERTSAPQVAALISALGVGALAALLNPLDRGPGVAFFLVALAGVVAIVAASPDRRRRSVLVGAVVAAALVAILVLRSEEGVALFGFLLAGGLTAATVTRARTLLGMVASVAAWPLASLRGLPLLGRTITAGRTSRGLWAVLRTGLITLVLLMIFGALFASGDALFGAWSEQLVPDLGWDSAILRGFTFVLAWGVTLTGAYLALNPPRVQDAAVPLGGALARTYEWLVPLGAVTAVFVAFHVAQATAMWGGREYLAATTGLTYAQYVHQGFGQLTVATALTLVVVGIAIRKARTDSAGQRRLLVGAVWALCLLALGVVVSALTRMSLYQDAYGYTVLRLFVDGFEAWLGVLLVAVMVAVAVPRLRQHLPRFALITAAVGYLAFGLANPGAIVAEHNIDRYDAGKPLDAAYLRSLGDDAVPTVVARLDGLVEACVVGADPDQLAEPWSRWTVAKARADRARAQAGPFPGYDQCTALFDTDQVRPASR